VNLNRQIIEKVIGVSLVAFSSFLLYKLVFGLYGIIDTADITWNELSIIKIVKNYHSPLIRLILSIFFAVYLIFGKRIGWIGTVIMIFANTIIFSIIFGKSLFARTIKIDGELWDMILMIVVPLAFFICGLVLLRKEFQNKYKPNSKSWITIWITVLILSVDWILTR